MIPEDHSLPSSPILRPTSAPSPSRPRASNTASTLQTPASNDPERSFEARPFPQNYDDFIAHVEDAVHHGGLQVDEGLYEEIFGGEDALGRR